MPRESWRRSGDNTRAVFVEAISNPLLRLVDLPAIAGELGRRRIELIVDASMASPAVLRPIEHGASIVMHSLTKFISGHGDVTGGWCSAARTRWRGCATP